LRLLQEMAKYLREGRRAGEFMAPGRGRERGIRSL
jgi:hypothetical protein